MDILETPQATQKGVTQLETHRKRLLAHQFLSCATMGCGASSNKARFFKRRFDCLYRFKMICYRYAPARGPLVYHHFMVSLTGALKHWYNPMLTLTWNPCQVMNFDPVSVQPMRSDVKDMKDVNDLYDSDGSVLDSGAQNDVSRPCWLENESSTNLTVSDPMKLLKLRIARRRCDPSIHPSLLDSNTHSGCALPPKSPLGIRQTTNVATKRPTKAPCTSGM